jgi:exopolysaccharide production protein ExoZ
MGRGGGSHFLYLIRLRDRVSADGRQADAFARSRILRLFPAAWICASLTFAVRWGETGVGGDYLRTLVLWPTGPWIDGVYWTLGIELVFYAAIICVLLAKIPLSRMVTAMAIWGSLLWPAHLANHLAGGPISDQFTLLDRTNLSGVTLLTHGCFFAVGMLFWSTTRLNTPVLHKILLFPTIGSGILYSLASGKNSLIENGDAARWETLYPVVMWIAAIIIMALSIRFNKVILLKLSTWRKTIRILGLATYPLYLIHEHVGMRLTLVFLPLLQPLVGFASMVILAFLLLIPEAYIRWLLRFLLDRSCPAH